MPAKDHTTTTGHIFSEEAWLDAHFEACLPEYTEALRSVGIPLTLQGASSAFRHKS